MIVNRATGAASGGHAEGNRLSQIEGLFGSGGADVVTGNGAANGLRGTGGADVLTGGGGADVFEFIQGAGVDQDIAQIGGNMHIVIGTDTITLEGVQRASISADDFLA